MRTFKLLLLLAVLALPGVASATSGYLPVLQSQAEGNGYGQGIKAKTPSGDCTMNTNGVFTCTGFGSVSTNGLTVTGAAVSLNASSNFAVNIGTGTTTSTVTIGGTGAQTIAVGNGAGAKTVALGSSNTTSTTTILAGTGGLVAGDATNGLRGYVSTSAPNGDTTLTSAACGTVQFIGAAGDDFTLPAPANGCRVRFIVDSAFASTSMTIVTNSSANVIQGSIDVNSTRAACASSDTVTFLHSAETVGDWVEVVSDGTSWFINGVGVLASSVACSQAS
jgi:hypothetical protein